MKELGKSVKVQIIWNMLQLSLPDILLTIS